VRAARDLLRVRLLRLVLVPGGRAGLQALARTVAYARRLGWALDPPDHHRGRHLADRRDRQPPVAQAGLQRVVPQLGQPYHDARAGPARRADRLADLPAGPARPPA